MRIAERNPLRLCPGLAESPSRESLYKIPSRSFCVTENVVQWFDHSVHDFAFFQQTRVRYPVCAFCYFLEDFFCCFHVDDIGDENPEQPEREAAKSHSVWQYFTVTNNTDPEKGGAKNALCTFCDKNFNGRGTFRARRLLGIRRVMQRVTAGPVQQAHMFRALQARNSIVQRQQHVTKIPCRARPGPGPP